jgi:hypothetical protein
MLGTACVEQPVEWQPEKTLASAATLALDDAGSPVAGPESRVTPASAPTMRACPGSVRFAGAGGALYAVWWAPRPDGSAALLASRSDDGGSHWGDAVPVDTLDESALGCERPAPAIVADAATGYVHVVYFLSGPSGPGVFFAHSMERGALYHAPVPIVYGDRPVRAAVAADGDLVAVAYEDPNAARPRIGLALSRTMGHLFEERLPPVSGANVASTEPRVAVRGRTVAVAWTARPSGSSGAEPGVTVVRLGRLRDD